MPCTKPRDIDKKIKFLHLSAGHPCAKAAAFAQALAAAKAELAADAPAALT